MINEVYVPKDDLTCNHLHGNMGVTQKIKKAMYDAAKQFVYIGFLLWEVKQYEYFYEGGYGSVYEYAEAELNLKRSSTKNFIAIAETFGTEKKPGGELLHTMHLKKEFSDYSYSQLTEMLAMTPAQREKATPSMTIKELRLLKRGEDKPKQEQIDFKTLDKAIELSGQTSGQTEPKIDWISVNTGLPEVEKRVMVCCETKARQRNINLAYWDGKAWHGNGSMAGVTHWMELPSLPMLKKDQQAKQTVTINNYWDDIDPAIIRRMLKACHEKYSPRSCYKITIEIKKKQRLKKSPGGENPPGLYT